MNYKINQEGRVEFEYYSEAEEETLQMILPFQTLQSPQHVQELITAAIEQSEALLRELNGSN